MNPSAPAPPPCILFVAEMVTLAHLARPLALLQAAQASGWECVLACAAHGRRFQGSPGVDWRPLDSLSATTFAQRLRQGRPVYTASELAAYVREDLSLIEAVQPALVIGDFRLSLSISARLSGVPYATISNTYWSPYALDQAVVLPVLPWTRYVPLGLAQKVFDRIHPFILAKHCQPLNEVRQANGLQALAPVLRAVYTDADHVLCADAPSLFPLRPGTANHWPLGPILWSPPVPLPAWWGQWPSDRPLVYVTLGSSGDPALLAGVVETLAALDVSVMVATAGASLPPGRWRNVWASDFLPGEQAAALAALVVCNGGSPTSQQAVHAGVPVLGICGNMDQFLNMRGLVLAGLGLALRADRLSGPLLARTATTLLNRDRQQAKQLAALHAGPDYQHRLLAFLDAVCPLRGRPGQTTAVSPSPSS